MAAFDAFGASSSIIPHPAITEPKLYLSGIPQSTTDTDLADVFRECLRARFIIERSGSVHAPAASGYVEFEHLRNAEKAYATLQGISLGANTPPGGLVLSAHPPSSDSTTTTTSPPTSPTSTSPTATATDPKPSPSSVPRIIKQLPPTTTPADIFELFRIFGPLYRISIPSPGRGRFAVVEYYEESHADAAASEMNFTEIGGNSIIVEKFDPRKPAAWANANAQSFVPSGPKSAGLSPTATPWSPPVSAHQAVGGQSMHAPGGGSQQGGSQPGRGSNQHWDPCNLFIKNLDPSITSQDLFLNFKGYGKIVSARVMRHDATGESKEFGFVSFEKEDDAARALQGMDGIRVRNRTIVVRFHEPKKYREARIRPTGLGASGSAGGSPDRDLVNGLAGTKIEDHSGSSSPHMSSSLDLSTLPQTGASVYAPSSGGDRDASSPALPTGTSERDRLLHAVRRIDSSRVEEIVELLLALPKKERAMALFSEEVLARKVADAKEILDIQDAEEQEPKSVKKEAEEPKTVKAEEVEPATSSTATAAAASNGDAQPKSVEALGSLPATEIIASLKENRPAEVEAPASADVAEMDDFISALENRPSTEQKQRLGDRLFKAVKACGVKGAPKITIHLLDTEDLRALGHLMLYPEALKAKVLAVQLKK